MAVTEESRRSAADHISAAIDVAHRFPEKVFRGDWHAYYFFDSDRILLAPEAIYTVHALLEAEDASCAVMQQLSRHNDPGKPLHRMVIDRDVPPRPVHDFLHTEEFNPTRFLEDFGIASDRGRWCIYVEGQAELGVLAVRDEGLRAAIDPARRLLDAIYIDKAAKDPHCYALRPGVRPAFLDGLRRSYGWGTSPSNWGRSSTRETPGLESKPPALADGCLALRTTEHARALYPLLAGTTVCDTLVWDGPDSLESFLDTFVNQPGDPSHRHFTILGGGEPVGSLSIRPGFQPQRGDLGYWVGIPHQGRGYATAAVQEALRISFTDMGMEKVEACAFVGNFASRRVLEKCGFVQEGLTRKAILKRGRWLDEWVFGITREEWSPR